jgi:opacity protein-like surface antigen
MFFSLSPKLALCSFFFAAALPIYSQVVPAASESSVPLSVGAGISNFDLDFGPGRRMEGVTAWVDWNVPHTPSVLSGFGLEIEGRDINFGRPSSLTQMRQDTAEGGPIYTLRHYRDFHPYAKYLIGIGSIDFPHIPGTPSWYTHDTRTVYAPGGGLEYKVFRSIWVRGDYEYQFWPKIFGPHSLNPNGVTVGAMYDFRHRNRP